MKRLILKLSLLVLLIIFWLFPLTSSNYYDTETSSGNTISAGHWDTTAPIIFSVSHLVATPEGNNDTKAIISWTTNEEADSNLYWTTDNIAWETVSDSNYVINHSLEIFGLSTDAAYYYYVTSSDQAGNTGASIISSFVTAGMTLENFPPTTDVVINEFLPNPIGGGEWIEFYNRGAELIDLTGWYLTDSDPSHILNITTANTISSDASTDDLWIAPGEFMVVYQNGDSDFLLDNNIDQINLYDNALISNLIDQYSYDTSLGDVVLENKSIARYPDGSDSWFDPIPSPLSNNILEKIINVTPSRAVMQTSGEMTINYEEPLFSSSAIWYPGLTLRNTIKVKNTGKLTESLGMKATNISQTGKLAEVLIFKVSEDDRYVFGGKEDKTLKDFWDMDSELKIADLSSNETKIIGLTIYMPKTLGNEYQDQKAKFDILVGFSGSVLGVTTKLENKLLKYILPTVLVILLITIFIVSPLFKKFFTKSSFFHKFF